MTIRRRRGGFTLIELLTVIAILSLLAAITAAGVSRVRNAQKVRNSEQTVSKLQLALDQQWKAVIDQAMDDKVHGRIPTAIVTACNKDLDLSGSAWAYFLTRRAFPNTFVEARTAVMGPGGYALPAQATFTAAGLPNAGANAQEEGAGLLYLILSNSANRGMNFNADDATQGAQGLSSTNNFKVFKDAWGMPITFIRFANVGYNGELNNPPYVNPNAATHDPLDPSGKLTSGSPVNVQGSLNSFPANAAAIGSATAFNGTNRQPAVISAGADMVFESFGGDDIVGYRLRREGSKGN